DARLRRTEEIGRLDVAMEYASLVCGMKGLANVVRDVADEPERKAATERLSPSSIELREIQTVDVFLREIGAAAMDTHVNGVNRGMARNAGRESRFVAQSTETFAVLLGLKQRLDDDGDRELTVAREPNATHPSHPDGTPDFEDAELLSGEVPHDT